MVFKYFSKIKDSSYLADVKEMLILCDKEFVPPLSARQSTTDKTLKPTTTADAQIPEKYFSNIAGQRAILAIEDGRVVGLMSFFMNHICDAISSEFQKNVYVSTVVVHPDFRQHGIAGKMYAKLLSVFPKHYVFTRTWSSNISHIRILLAIGFHEHYVIHNDRGENIDTVYYMYKPKKHTIIQAIEQYKLVGNIMFFAFLSILTLAFVVLWFVFKDSSLVSELSLAVFTSLMASVLCLICDTFLKIRESKNDAFINTLKDFGIDNLQFNKNEMLEKILPHCRHEIWISGYRLIMTASNSFRQAMVTACMRSNAMKIRMLVCPPWTNGYKLVYGVEDVTLNYIRVINTLLECHDKYKTSFEIHFSEKPLFNDTYKVDDRFVSGPYLHCKNTYNHRITAKDFFSLDINDPQKELYNIIEDDYISIWNESFAKLDIEKYRAVVAPIADPSKLSAQERTDLLVSCCIPM